MTELPEEVKREIELLPCPFCGGEPIKKFIGNNATKSRSVEIKCSECFISKRTGAIRFDHEWCDNKAIEHWNERVKSNLWLAESEAHEKTKIELESARQLCRTYSEAIVASNKKSFSIMPPEQF